MRLLIYGRVNRATRIYRANQANPKLTIMVRDESSRLVEFAKNLPSKTGGRTRRTIRLDVWGRLQTYGWRGGKARSVFYAKLGGSIQIVDRVGHRRLPLQVLQGPVMANEFLRQDSPAFQTAMRVVTDKYPKSFERAFNRTFYRLKSKHGL